MVQTFIISFFVRVFSSLKEQILGSGLCLQPSDLCVACEAYCLSLPCGKLVECASLVPGRCLFDLLVLLLSARMDIEMGYVALTPPTEEENRRYLAALLLLLFIQGFPLLKGGLPPRGALSAWVRGRERVHLPGSAKKPSLLPS